MVSNAISMLLFVRYQSLVVLNVSCFELFGYAAQSRPKFLNRTLYSTAVAEGTS